jgi:hypothetical protein
MGDLITRITSLFNMTKAVTLTLPGLVGAVGIVLLLWPPLPENQVPQNVTLTATGCNVPLKALSEPTRLDAAEIKEIAVKNQSILEASQRDLQKCNELMSSLLGREETLNANLKSQIEFKQKEQASVQETFINYQKSNNPLLEIYRSKLATVNREIDSLRASILQNEQGIRDRNRRIQENVRYQKMVTERLADPGRLRPQKSFDEFLSGLSDHTLALVLLSIAIGYVLDPFNRAVYGAFYDSIGRNIWNILRISRPPAYSPVKGR